MKKLYAAAFFSVFFLGAFSQSIEQANSAYAKRNFHTALDLYQKVLKKPGKKTDLGETKFQVANCHRNLGQLDEALNWYQQAKSEGYSNPVYLLYEGETYLKRGNYEKAQTDLELYLAEKPQDKEATRLLNNCGYALSAGTDSSVTVSNEKSLNTAFNEYAATPVGNKVIFTSSRIEEKGEAIYPYDGQAFSDIYQAAYFKEDKKWSKANKVEVLNTPLNDGVLSFCSKNQTAYFTRCNDSKGNDEFCKIMESVYDAANGRWSAPKPIALSFKQVGDMQQPSVTAEGNRIYFASKMDGSLGGSDLWVISKNGDQWGEPVNLGNAINTVWDEMFPTVKDSVLFFASEGHLGYGGLDLFSSVQSNGTWSKPQNLRAPLNSSGDDFGISFNPDNSSGFISSNRYGGVGADDIYSFYPSPILLTLRGRVTDAENGNIPVGTKVILSSDGRVDTVYINKTYEYFFYLDRDKDYKLSVSRPGYFGDSRKFTTKGITKPMELSASTGYNFDFPIRKITKEEIKLDDIYYDPGSIAFREESKASLDKLAKLLEDTPGAIVQINSHTDEKGKFDFNMTLSENRAKAVGQYLIAKGINSDRLFWKGFGYTRPVIKGAQTEEEHQKNRRTTFQVLKSE